MALEDMTTLMKRSLLAFSLIAIATAAVAAPKTFTIVGDKLEYRNLATVESTTEFETFTGKTTKVSGSFTFDPSAKTGNGKLTVDLASLDTGIPTRNDHLRSAGWLDTDKHPTAVFQTTRVQSSGGDNYRVTGQFSLHGVTKTITTKATLKYRAESEATKKAGFAGNVTHLFTKFDVKLSDYGIKIPAVADGKVNPTVTITVSAYATAK
jgi:polyisoprenoid-binding protein YceI